MQIHEYIYEDTTSYLEAARVACPHTDVSRIMFFDIETTGLSAGRSALYLIGCMYLEGDRVMLRQYFSEGYGDEAELLMSFSKELEARDTLVHFNGNTFDIPYLKGKYSQHIIADPFDGVTSVDIYQILRPLKKLMGLKSMTQKALELYAGLSREDEYDGGELIAVYKQYLRLSLMEATGTKPVSGDNILVFPNSSYQDEQWLGSHKVRISESSELLRLLLLHNHDDMEGMLTVASLISVIRFFEGDFTVADYCQEGDFLHVAIDCGSEIVKRSLLAGGYIKTSKKSKPIEVSIPVYEKELKVFIKNYKDYVYLPEEDNAIHVSFATFIPKDRRVKAKPATCYTHCRGRFVKVHEEFMPEGAPVIKEDYKDKVFFAGVDSLTDDMIKAAVVYSLLEKREV